MSSAKYVINRLFKKYTNSFRDYKEREHFSTHVMGLKHLAPKHNKVNKRKGNHNPISLVNIGTKCKQNIDV